MLPSVMARRLAAILSADAVGYSRLMAADEAAALHAVDAQRALLRERSTAPGARTREARSIFTSARRCAARCPPTWRSAPATPAAR
jgi:hypothetical protein